MPGKNNTNSFLDNYFGEIAGAGLGLCLGFASLSFLKPIVSLVLSNLPILPHLVFLPTFTGPFILVSMVIAGGYVGHILNSDNHSVSNNSSENQQPKPVKRTVVYTYTGLSSQNNHPTNHSDNDRSEAPRRDYDFPHRNRETREEFRGPIVPPPAYGSWNTPSTTPSQKPSSTTNSTSSNWDPVEKPKQSTAEASLGAKAIRINPDFSNSGNNFSHTATSSTPDFSAFGNSFDLNQTAATVNSGANAGTLNPSFGSPSF